jgi:nitroreductase
MNEAMKTLYERRSIRRYQCKQITREELDAVVRAGVCAPSGKNGQSAIIVAVQDKATRDELSKLNAAVLGTQSDPFYGAPTVLIVLADANSPYAVEDGSLVLGNLMNAAKAIGLGSCWINRAKEVFASDAGKALLKKWGVEGDWIGIGHCILGYPDEEPAMKTRKENYVTYVL